MDVWQHLEISPTADIKAIKRAYAKKIKIVRPDEQPEPFQILHSAYKQALKLAQSDGVQPGNEQQHNYETVITDNTVITPDPLYSQASADDNTNNDDAQQQPHIECEIDRLTARVESLLNDSSQRHILSSWEFLVENPLILDSSFNWQLGVKVFERVSDHNKKNSGKRCRVHRVDAHIANYLNDIFNWISEENYLRSTLGDDNCNHLLSLIVDKNQPTCDTRALAGLRGAKSVKQIRRVRNTPIEYYYFGGPFKRLLALAADALLVYPCALLAFEANKRFIFSDTRPFDLEPIFFATFVSVYLISSWLFETSMLQATPGKMLLGLRVTDTHHGKLETLHGLLRSLMFAITSLGFYITIVINNWLGGNFLHDRLSRSYVIDYRRSYREHNRKR